MDKSALLHTLLAGRAAIDAALAMLTEQEAEQDPEAVDVPCSHPEGERQLVAFGKSDFFCGACRQIVRVNRGGGD